MNRYVLRRIASSLITIGVLVVVVFLAARVLPGDPAKIRAGSDATPEMIEQLRVQYGFDRPMGEQFADYVSRLVRGDLGTSVRTGQPIVDELFGRLPATIELALAAFLIALVIGLILGTAAAVNRGGPLDAVIRGLAVIGTSIPAFWLALLAILVLVYTAGIFPSPMDRLPLGVSPPSHVTGLYTIDAVLVGDLGLAWTALRQLALPALLLGVLNSISILKITRSAMIDSLRSDYVRTARSFGFPERSVLWSDALRNALPPVITSVGLVAGHLIAGNIIIEQIFSWPGIGRYLNDALQQNDLEVVQAFVLVVGAGYVILNVLVDLLYSVVDPRIEFGKASS